MRTALSVLILTAAAAAQAPPPSGEKGSIGGIVINQVTNAPIKKAQVGIGPMQLATDASGHFVADQLAAGTYQVYAGHPDFPPMTSPSPGSQVRVTLEAGEHKKDITVALTPGVIISGKVLDDDGDPLSGCFVQVMRFTYQGGKKELAQVNGNGTDDRGEYRVANLAAGSYYLKASCRRPLTAARTFAPKDALVDAPEETFADQFYPGSIDADGATKLKPPPGAELRDIDFRMRKQRSVSIHGKVTRPEGVDLNDYVQVAVSPKTSSDRRSFRAARFERSGEFEIHGVIPGSYWLTATNYDREAPLYGRMDLDVGDTSINQIVLPMNPGFTISGTVETESPPSGQPPSTEPVAAKPGTRRVQLLLADTGNRFQRPSADVKEDGEFSISGVTPGDWALIFSPLLPGTYIKSVRFADQEVSSQRLTISQSSAGPLKLVIGANPGDIDGAVQLENSQSGIDVTVVLVPDKASRPGFQGDQQIIADAVGHFSFHLIAPGNYHLFAFESGSSFQRIPDYADLLKSLGEEVTVEEGGHVSKQIKLIPAGAIADALKELE